MFFFLKKKRVVVLVTAAENLARGQPTPESVVTAWMNSAGESFFM
jgi:uncharacterized protein YkwD